MGLSFTVYLLVTMNSFFHVICFRHLSNSAKGVSPDIRLVNKGLKNLAPSYGEVALTAHNHRQEENVAQAAQKVKNYGEHNSTQGQKKLY